VTNSAPELVIPNNYSVICLRGLSWSSPEALLRQKWQYMNVPSQHSHGYHFSQGSWKARGIVMGTGIA